MLNQRLKTLDPILIFSMIGLLAIGLVALYSSSQSLVQSGSATNYFWSQIRWILIGFGALLAIAFLPNRLLYELSYILYGIALFFLVLVLIWGTEGYGAVRWLRFGGFGFQPSEFAKIATLLAVARYLSEERLDINRLKTFLAAAAFLLAPFLLIAKQPDLGTALVFIVMSLPVLFWAGLRWENLVLILAPGLTLFASFNHITFSLVMVLILVYLFYVKPPMLLRVAYFILNVAIGLLTPFLWNQLKDYQKQRITTFWNPEADPLGSGYQIIQSKVAIGSGGFLGKGFMEGSQTQLRFLPEQHTDFIFAVIGEEFGFLGILVALILFTVFLVRIVQMANTYRSRFSSVFAIGAGSIIGFHMFINAGMTIGLFPVTGLPLPFVSYGGSALLTNMSIVGILLNFYRHRFEY
ncbi:MAG: rod shape-determining protein RodA [Calditrichaceae bacterium]|nr:rod shape-determining protein RodA [Calditrichia bacterium]NUQ40370.1 rod shape-determining protein RodA [Calditrichaceae bacterium]